MAFPDNAETPPGQQPKEAGDTSEAPASVVKASKRSRVFCTFCRKANHTADVCRNRLGTLTIIAGGSAITPPGTTFSLTNDSIIIHESPLVPPGTTYSLPNAASSAGIKKKKSKKSKKNKKKKEKREEEKKKEKKDQELARG
ncbi:hypothetical protein FLONG3_10890 [Fusarium longipes]|uniref:Uncharacterized protein n=1 Tax=Fusarium longipes TaxID=694270 RepID=A0A395RK02_9HYPO|nr:hypothetical protein FLONG3_10890 [Fusarium longipes]